MGKAHVYTRPEPPVLVFFFHLMWHERPKGQSHRMFPHTFWKHPPSPPTERERLARASTSCPLALLLLQKKHRATSLHIRPSNILEECERVVVGLGVGRSVPSFSEKEKKCGSSPITFTIQPIRYLSLNQDSGNAVIQPMM